MRGNGTIFGPVAVRDMLRLSHALHEVSPDPAARKRFLLERLCRLLRADAGVCVVSHVEGAPGGASPRGSAHSVSVSVVRYGMTEEDAWTLASGYRAPPPPDRKARRRRPTGERLSALRPVHRRAAPGANGASGGGHCAESVIDIPGMKLQACVALLRRQPAGRPFARRERVALDLVHSELAWVYGPDLPLLSPDGLPLSPRQRQTLQLLLAGNSEKEIATRMDLSPNTVHHYVKAIHRHFGVSSRSELLARWVRK
jgi:DNA-binding CsgD family transcriptional regulator